MKYLFIILSLIFCCKTINGQKGLEIYQVKHLPSTFNDIKEPECYCCFEPKKKDLYDRPLLDESDIIKFDWENQKIVLNEKGQMKVNELEIPLRGLAVALVLNEEIIYGFWFWNRVSSISCDRVYTWPTVDFKIQFGIKHINFVYGDDPRFNPILKDYVMTKYYKTD